MKGGSRKTWSKTKSSAHYWPKEWLPLEPQFKNVRIHTFGYASDWGEIKASCVTVHDFGQALLSELDNSPLLGGPENNTPIVFVAHSMGGIVVKKVLILAKQDPIYHKIASRIHSLFFLATPHRGSDIAQLLGKVLQLFGVYGSKAYVENIVPNSEAIHSINDQFRHICHEVQLWSFFETVKTSLGLIVEKDSAILGLPRERIQLLNADHRNVCKFDDPSDNSYRTLRNAFGSAIALIKETLLSASRKEHQSDMRKLSNLFGHAGKPESDLATISDRQVEGTCTWLTDKLSFNSWQEGLKGVPNVFWLRGDPATGKSTIVGYVARYLEEANTDYSLFFFKHSMKEKSTTAELLCSLAWQMAYTNSDIRRRLLAVLDEGIVLDLKDTLMLWRMVFVSRIFCTELHQPHYWIIDALDESSDYAVLCSLLAKIDKDFKLRIFVSSRPDLTIERLLSKEKVAVTVESTSLETSLEDITKYLVVHANDLPVDSDEEQKELLQAILEQSNGNFLWTTLVVEELKETVSQERVIHILKSVPEGIDDLYARILRKIFFHKQNAEVAKAILRWATCAARPLTTDELRESLVLDINETVLKLEQNAGAICGSLVYVDDVGRVHATHQTVKNYLYRDSSSEDSSFALDQRREHATIARVCLEFLCSDAMRSVRHRRTNVASRETKRTPFTTYAISYFSEHLSKADPLDETLIILLNKFFLNNSLTWIELIAATQNIGLLTETAKNVEDFIKKMDRYHLPLKEEVQNVSEWADNLIRLVAQFGRALVSSPSAIHFLIPPVCPSASIIFKNFANYPRPLKLVGLSHNKWDDQLSCIQLPPSRICSLACGDESFALGLACGNLHVYHNKTFLEIFKVDHEGSVSCLAISHNNDLLAAANRHKVSLWDMATGFRVWTWTTSFDDLPLAFTFTKDDAFLIAATRGNLLVFRDSATGKIMKESAFFDFNDDDDKTPFPCVKEPMLAAFSLELGLLGVVYRNRPISFWETESCTFAGHYHKSVAVNLEPYINAFVFNPVPEKCLAAIAFQDGDISVFDPWSQTTRATVDCIFSSCLAASAEGTILASGDHRGEIKLFDFGSLSLLYHIKSQTMNIQNISFSRSGLRFYDIRQRYCNVWEPSAMVRLAQSIDSSRFDGSTRIISDAYLGNGSTYNIDEEITALTAHHSGDFVFTGFENGSVKVYSTASGNLRQDLIHHDSSVAILHIEWNEQQNLLASVDNSGDVLVHQLREKEGADGPFAICDKILKCLASPGFEKILFDPHGKLMLLSTSEWIQLWDLENRRMLKQKADLEGGHNWMTHPQDSTKLVNVMYNGSLIAFGWATLEQESTRKRFPFTFSVFDTDLFRLLRLQNHRSEYYALVGHGIHDGVAQIFVSPSNDLSSAQEIISLSANYKTLAKMMKAIIGSFKSQLVFLSTSDWVCSLRIDGQQQSAYTRHFFVPQQWQRGGTGYVPMLVTKRGSVVLASGSELAVFHNGLDFEEQVKFDDTHAPE